MNSSGLPGRFRPDAQIGTARRLVLGDSLLWSRRFEFHADDGDMPSYLLECDQEGWQDTPEVEMLARVATPLESDGRRAPMPILDV